MFVSKKRLRRIETMTYALGGVGVALGTAGTLTSIITSVSVNKKVSKIDEDLMDTKRHVAKCEEQITSYGKCIGSIQTTMQMNGLLSR